ncbi:MAG TPA: hypothetical protein VG733_02005 [Chthoniobacteraceae bacterium]|nr:hypothetical protein [Chthoniobacteraceae bacterium]
MMNIRLQKKIAFLLAGGIGAALPFLMAADRQASDDDAIPKGYPMNRYALLWEHSPFIVASAEQEAPPPSFAQNLVLGGVGDVVTVVNRTTQERFTVDTKPNEQGIKVVSVQMDDDPLKTKVTLQKGAETATISFDRGMLAMAQTPPAQPARPAAISGVLTIPNASIQIQGGGDQGGPPATVRQVRRPPIPAFSTPTRP